MTEEAPSPRRPRLYRCDQTVGPRGRKCGKSAEPVMLIDRNLCPEHREWLLELLKNAGLYVRPPPPLEYIPKFVVITKIPTYDGTEETEGNSRDGCVYELNGILYYGDDLDDKIMDGSVRWIRDQVFRLGEILIVNEWEREVSGLGRRPKNWDGVEYARFDVLEDAIRRSIEVRKEAGLIE